MFNFTKRISLYCGLLILGGCSTMHRSWHTQVDFHELDASDAEIVLGLNNNLIRFEQSDSKPHVSTTTYYRQNLKQVHIALAPEIVVDKQFLYPLILKEKAQHTVFDPVKSRPFAIDEHVTLGCNVISARVNDGLLVQNCGDKLEFKDLNSGVIQCRIELPFVDTRPIFNDMIPEGKLSINYRVKFVDKSQLVVYDPTLWQKNAIAYVAKSCSEEFTAVHYSHNGKYLAIGDIVSTGNDWRVFLKSRTKRQGQAEAFFIFDNTSEPVRLDLEQELVREILKNGRSQLLGPEKLLVNYNYKGVDYVKEKLSLGLSVINFSNPKQLELVSRDIEIDLSDAYQ